MIPVLIVPVLSADRVGDMFASVDVPIGLSIVVDNGADVAVTGSHVIHLPHNIGVAAAWNLGIKVTPAAAWWAITNDDIVFASGDLASLVETMADPAPRVVTLDGFAAFGINRAALAIAGWFDENYHPAYVEDCDYERRCALLDVPIIAIPAGLHHERSSTIRNPHWGAENDRTYPANLAYHRAKWGGDIRGGERFATPFDASGSPAHWTLDPERLASQAWQEPVR